MYKKIRINFTAILTCCLLLSCGNNEPIVIGFIGGTSGRVADLGVSGRDGVILALEEKNAAGGIRGRKVELSIKDDEQNQMLAEKHLQAFVREKVAAIIGPMTSSIAVAIVPMADKHKILLVSPTTTTNTLLGKDDYFFRSVIATRYHAAKSAVFQLKRGVRRFAIGYDTNNLAYTKSWKEDFESVVREQGGVIHSVAFASSQNTPFVELAKELVETKPDGIVLICNSVDAALFAQQIRKLSPEMPLIFSEWAGTERLIELGGKWVDGAHVPQYLNRESKDPKYVQFRDRYLQRFNREPGYPGMLSYNAANIVLTAIEQQRSGEDLKTTILRLKRFPGVQQEIVFDAFGDTQIRTYITEVKNGAFMVVE